MASLTAHTAKKWRGKGYYVEMTESINRIRGGMTRRHDLFGFVDMVALKPGEIILIQVTSRSNMSARFNKMRDGMVGNGQFARPIREIIRMLAATGVEGGVSIQILIEGWQKDEKAWKWVCKERWVEPQDLEAT